MKKQRIIGRIKECERLDECMNSDRAQLIIVYGRRRVGKTYLINEYFHKDFAFKITGIYIVIFALYNSHKGGVRRSE
jgi:AAA+ ATPase superfamily predicted ATPase